MGGRLALRGMEDFGIGSFADGYDWLIDYWNPAVDVCAIKMKLVFVSWETKRLDVLSVIVLSWHDLKVHLMGRKTSIQW